MKFKVWSQTKPEVIKEMKPQFNLRSWEYLEESEKKKSGIF